MSDDVHSVDCFFFFFQAEDGIRDLTVTGVQTCALPILRNLDRAKELVCTRVRAANEFLELLGSHERADSGEHVGLLDRLAPRLLPIAIDAGRVVYEALQRGESVLLEGAQGALLDVDHGTYPYVTSS